MFPSIDHWDLALWAVAGYIAVVTLVRLMVYHRDRLLIQVHAERELERRREGAKAKARADRGNAA